VPTRSEEPTGPARPLRRALRVGLLITLPALPSGCGGEPSPREVSNARAFEALLTAVSLRNEKELEQDASAIDERHAAGTLSDRNYNELRAIVDRARARDWQGAEKRAYEFRAQFGDRGSYFK
jgi:hypothetical protein